MLNGVLARWIAIAFLFAQLSNAAPTPPSPSAYPAWKYRLDRTLVLLTSPITLPAVGAIALAIAFVDGGPVIFTQERVGYQGKPFRIYKFRTMQNGKVGPSRTVINDERITRLGAWLRRFHLDELPQLWNVLRGEMSLVGPRPHLAAIVEELREQVPGYIDRVEVLPGLTGPGQIYLDYGGSMDVECRRALLDSDYRKNLSLWRDLRVLFETPYYVLYGHGAR